MKSKKGDTSASDASDNGSKSKAIAHGAAKVFNKMGLKARPSTSKSPAEESPTRFQIVHTPDRSLIDMPLPDIPTTNEEFYAAISCINAQGNLHGQDSLVEGRSVSASSPNGSQQSPDSRSMVPRTVVTSPVSTPILLGPRNNGSLDKVRVGLNAAEPKPSPTAAGKTRPAYAQRIASDGVPPRPLSERPLIKDSIIRARPSLQMQHGSMSTPETHSSLPILSKSASGKRYSNNKINSSEKNGRRRPRRVPSVDSTDSDDELETPSHATAPAGNILDGNQKTQDSGVGAGALQNGIKCYFCHEDCQPQDNLCSKCQSRFQPQVEVFDYSESEYEDIEFHNASTLSPGAEKTRGTSSRSSKRRTTWNSRPREKSRGCSEISSVSQAEQVASRSASTSPTSHVAMELKIVPPQDIKIRTVTSPTAVSAGDSRSALHHIQQALKPRAPVSPASQESDSISLGKVRSGEVRRVDCPDIIKSKHPSPKQKSFQSTSQEHQHQSQGSFKAWVNYYDDGDMSSERHSGSSGLSTRAGLSSNGQESSHPTASGTYDRITSIYDLYASFDET